jgi:uncharacterized protein (TIRG00374 family)
MDQSIAIGEDRSLRRTLLTWLVYVAAAAGLAWVLHGFDWPEFFNDLVFVDWKWVVPAVALDILSYVCQALRWNYVLRPLGAPPLLRSTQAIYVGLFTNEILPLRGGEIIRAYLVSHWTQLDFSVVLSSVAIERLLDGIWLAIGFGITSMLVPLPGIIRDGARILGGAVLAGVILLAAVLALGLRVTHALERTKAGGRGLVGNLLHAIDRLFEGLQTIGHSASLYWAVLASLLLLFVQILAVWAMMYAYGLYYSFWVAAAVLFILHLGTAIPNAPANIGSYQVAATAGLLLFGVDKTTAAEFSIVMFAILTVPLLIIGLIAVLTSGLTLQDIRRHVRRKLAGHRRH